MTIPIEAVARKAREHGIRTFMETGTHVGSSLAKALPHFDSLYSVEFGRHLYQKCVDKFKGESKVRLYHGSSRVLLPAMIRDAGDVPILFWLDAHGSGGDTVVDGVWGCPIRDELEFIAASGRKDHVVVIDDLRDMCGGPPHEVNGKTLHGGYPNLDELKALLGKINTDYKFEVISTASGVLMAYPGDPARS